ncbi:hypothetical protein [Streptomyces sp. NPDC020362]
MEERLTDYAEVWSGARLRGLSSMPLIVYGLAFLAGVMRVLLLPIT